VAYENGKSTKVSPRGRVLNVLHIEDDPSVARAIARVLRLEGYKVFSAASGDEAVKLVRDGLLPDLILTDHDLSSEMTGYEVIIALAARLGFRPPTIMLTGGIDSRDDEIYPGVDRLLSKPADVNILLCEMGRLLDVQV
jgi:CheY-like chemotaxis protein